MGHQHLLKLQMAMSCVAEHRVDQADMATWQLLRKSWFGGRWELVDQTGTTQAILVWTSRGWFGPGSLRMATPDGVYHVSCRRWKPPHVAIWFPSLNHVLVQDPDGREIEWRPNMSGGLFWTMALNKRAQWWRSTWQRQLASLDFLEVVRGARNAGTIWRIGLSVNEERVATALVIGNGGPRKIDFANDIDPQLLVSFCSLLTILL